MATSKQTYECFVCKKNGFPLTRVYLDGKTEDGRTICKNEDMSPHQQKQQEQQKQSQVETSFPTTNRLPLLKTMDAKLDRLISLLEKEQYQPLNEIKNMGLKNC